MDQSRVSASRFVQAFVAVFLPVSKVIGSAEKEAILHLQKVNLNTQQYR